MKILPKILSGLLGRLLFLQAFLAAFRARQLPPDAAVSLLVGGLRPRLGSARGVYALIMNVSRLAARASAWRLLR